MTDERNIAHRVAVLLTVHCWNSKRRAGFHWIAQSLWEAGWEVYFVTDYLSLLDKARGDYRFGHLPQGRVRELVLEKERFFSYVCYHWWRPVSRLSPFLNRLTYRWFSRYARIPLPGLASVVRDADLLIFESSMGLMFFDRFKELNSHARFVYRVSDDMRLFRMHPVVLDTESRIAPYFDLVSVPTSSFLAKFAGLHNVRLQHHGIPIGLYPESLPNPYPANSRPNAVFAGNLFLDFDFIDRASRLFPEVNFHIIGPFTGLPTQANILAHGEMPQASLAPYVKYADIGLNTRTLPSLTDSNKMMQYAFCRLPVIMANLELNEKPYVFCYTPGDDTSIKRAIGDALCFDRSQITRSGLHSWADLTSMLVGDTADG